MTWDIADEGYAIYLDKTIPSFIKKHLPIFLDSIINVKEIKYWSIHPGGKGILDLIQKTLLLTDADMSHSRKILRNYGNMSSATIMFILKDIMENETGSGLGLTCAFGPGLAIPLKILDIGSGYGDHLRAIYHWGKRNNIPLELTGLDLNPCSAKAANLVDNNLGIKFISDNIFNFKPNEKYDICINALFTHHLKDDEIINLLKWMTLNSNYGWFINDLHRLNLETGNIIVKLLD